MKGKNEFSLPRWSNLAFTFEDIQRSAKYHFCFRISIKTKALSLVCLDPAHQALIDRILELKENRRNCRQIAEYLNDQGVFSWTGKRFYPELVFGVIRKARMKRERQIDAGVDVRYEIVLIQEDKYHTSHKIIPRND
jgi:hypothetical protein